MLLALLLILAGLAGAIAPQTAAAKGYTISVGGVGITSENAANITGPNITGKVSFDESTHTLILNNATIDGGLGSAINYYAVDDDGGWKIVPADGITIRLQGNNTLKSGTEPTISAYASIRITGGGSLTIKSGNSAIRVGYADVKEANLTIDGCTLTANRRIDVRGSLQINSSNVTVSDQNSGYTFQALQDFTLSGCKIVSPAGGEIKQVKSFVGSRYTVVTASGDIAEEVIIGTDNGPKPPEPEDKFTLEPKELKVDADGGKKEVTLSCDKFYYVSSTDKPDWLDVSGYSTGYTKSQTLTIIAKPNTGSKREGVITFKTDQGNVTLKVTQEGGAKPEEPKLTLNPEELEVDASAQKKKVTLTSDVPVHISRIDVPRWIDWSEESGEGYSKSYTLTISFEANTGAERTGEIIIKTTEGDVTLKVTQEAASTKPEAKFTLEPKELKVDADGGKKEVTLSCNVPYHIDDLNKPDWLSVSGNSPGSEAIQKMTIAVKANTGPERTGEIIFHTDKGDVTLKVTQAGTGTKPEPEKAVFTLEPKELNVDADGGKKEVTLSCNQAFELNKVTVPSWMERVPSSATSDEKSRVCAFNIQKNTGPERKGEIVFHTDKGDVTLKVTQEGKKEKPEPKPQDPEPTLTVSATSVTFPPEGGDPKIIPVKSSHGWSVERDVSKGTGDWITFGEQPEGLYISVEENTGTRQRAVQLFVISDKNLKNGQPLKRTVLVTQQAKKPAEAVSGLSINPAAMTMGSGGGMVGFNVYAGKGWTISGSPEWMHPDVTRGSGTRLVIVRFNRNESGAERTGKLTVKSDDGKAERTFTLTQRASQRKPSRPSDDGTYDYDLAIGTEEITVGPSEGAGSTISVATSRLWAGSTTEDWIRLESAVGRGNGSFTFSLAANPSKEMRHGTITVRTEHGMDELKVAIHQQGRVGDEEAPTRVKVSSVSLDPSSITVNGDLSTTLISAIVSPDNARNKGLLWMSSNAAVATVKVTGTSAVAAALSDRPQLRFAPDADDYALVTIVGKGKATITAATSDGSSIVARCEVNVLSTVANTVPYAPQAKVYTVGPTLYLSLPTPEAVQVYTLAGTLYRTWQAPAGDTSVTLPIGTYIIKVGQLTEKVVVR